MVRINDRLSKSFQSFGPGMKNAFKRVHIIQILSQLFLNISPLKFLIYISNLGSVQSVSYLVRNQHAHRTNVTFIDESPPKIIRVVNSRTDVFFTVKAYVHNILDVVRDSNFWTCVRSKLGVRTCITHAHEHHQLSLCLTVGELK